MTSIIRGRAATRIAFGASGQALAAALALAAFAAPASAQDAAPAAGQEDSDTTQDDGGILVTGIRASIANSVEQKRRSTSIVEVISAEDIGKLPDQSIAESLSRLPGLATQRLDGRASVVSIRGLAPDFTTTLLNGREQVSTSNNRGVELDQYPSELLNGAVVYKTPDASLIGQALGGTIDLKTVRPLAYGRRALAVGVRGEVNDLGKLNPDVSNKGYRFNISYIDSTADGTLGWAIGFARMVSPTGEERWQAWGYPAHSDGNLVIGGAKPYIKSNRLTRDGLMGVIEYQPDDRVHLTLDGYWSRFNDEQRLRGLELPFAWGGQGETLLPGYTVEDGLITSGRWSNVKAIVRNDVVHRDAEIFAGGLNLAYKTSDTLTFEADASFSKVDRTEENIEIYAGIGRGGANGVRDTMGFEVNPEGVIRFSPTLDYSDTGLFQLTDPRGWCGRPGFPGNCQDGFINAPKVKDQLAALRLQATQELGDHSLRVGVNYSEREKSLEDEGYVLTHRNYPANTPIPSDYLYDPVSLDFIGIPGIVAFDSARYFEDGNYTLTAESGWTSGRRTNSFTITEKVLVGYGQFNVDAPWVRGNVGVQVVHTDQSGDGFAASNQNGVTVVDPLTDGDTYTDILPSMNLNFELAPNMFIRFGAARVLARARLDQLNPGVGFSYDPSRALNTSITSSPWSATIGNMKLRPLIADAVDLAFEKYFGRGGYISVSGFYKYLESFIYRQNDVFDFTGYPYTGAVAPAIRQGIVSQWQNAGGGRVYGAEASASLPFGTLTRALDGFGVLVGGSYTRSSVTLGAGAAPTTLPGLSEWVVNSTVYFEKHGFQARVSGRYRTDFLAEVQGLSLARDLVSAKGEFLVDAQIGYGFESGPLKGLSFLVTGSNLTDEPFVTYQNGDKRQVRDHQRYGRNLMVGASYKF